MSRECVFPESRERYSIYLASEIICSFPFSSRPHLSQHFENSGGFSFKGLDVWLTLKLSSMLLNFSAQLHREMTTRWKPALALGCPRVHPHRPTCLKACAMQFPLPSQALVSKSTHSLKRSVSWPWKNNEAYRQAFTPPKSISPVTNNWVLQRDSHESCLLGAGGIV